jgi:uncharacterized protein YutE (UPF0331/DUF86 family)
MSERASRADPSRPASSVIGAEREHIRRRVRRLIVDFRALKAAIDDHFGPDLEPTRWSAAFESDDPEEVNRVAPVISGFERIVNGLVEAARSGLVASGIAKPVGTPETVRRDLEAVRDDGGLTKGQCDLLIELSRTRNDLQHDYVDVSADDARAAVRSLKQNVPALTKALNSWFERYDVGV